MSPTTTAPANESAKTSKSKPESKNNDKKEEAATTGAIQVAKNQLPGNRPVSSSSLEVHHTMSASGIRPVVSSGLRIVDTMSASGIRPISASTLHITGTLMGKRPIAPNEVEETEVLMGYLD